MRILICDDNPLAIEQIHKNLKSFFTYKHIKCPEVISYSCGEDLLNDTGNKDIVFLDIEMPGKRSEYINLENVRSDYTEKSGTYDINDLYAEVTPIDELVSSKTSSYRH